jgi:hypothetical protein
MRRITRGFARDSGRGIRIYVHIDVLPGVLRVFIVVFVFTLLRVLGK